MTWKKMDKYWMLSLEKYKICKAFGAGGVLLAYSAWGPGSTNGDQHLGTFYPKRSGSQAKALREAKGACEAHLMENLDDS